MWRVQIPSITLYIDYIQGYDTLRQLPDLLAYWQARSVTMLGYIA